MNAMNFGMQSKIEYLLLISLKFFLLWEVFLDILKKFYLIKALRPISKDCVFEKKVFFLVSLNEFFQIYSQSEVLFTKRLLKDYADGPCELKDIYTALKVEKSGVVSGYMEDLVTAGFVSHDFTWHLKTGSRFKIKSLST